MQRFDWGASLASRAHKLLIGTTEESGVNSSTEIVVIPLLERVVIFVPVFESGSRSY